MLGQLNKAASPIKTSNQNTIHDNVRDLKVYETLSSVIIYNVLIMFIITSAS